MRYQFIHAHRTTYGLTRLCAALAVSRSGYYAWCGRPESARSRMDRQLLTAIRHVHVRTRARYGALKTWRALLAAGLRCGRHRVARLRRLQGLIAQRTRRFRRVTDERVLPPPAPYLLGTRGPVARVNTVWVGDLTAIATRAGWLHLAVILDLYSRRVVGWAMSPKSDQHVTVTALRMALESRRPRPGLLHHTDQGPQYMSLLYRAMLVAHGVTVSMSRKGNCYDNAAMESFFSTLKNELIHDRDYRSREEAQTEIFEYIEFFYNRQRLHQSLDYVSPVQFESDHLSPF
jgi:putative transposase